HDTEKGEERWRLVLTDPASGQTKTSVGPFETPLEGELAFDSAENMAFFATNSQIMAVQLNSGEMAWKINGPAPYKGGVTVAQDRVYAVNEEGVIFAHDGRSGRKIWESALE